jgi:phosphate transport system permease protein
MTTVVEHSESSEIIETGRERKLSAGSDKPYQATNAFVALAFSAIGVLFIYSIVSKSIPGWEHTGLGLLYKSDWNYGSGTYGALPLILGTLLTTGVALLLAVPVGLGSALSISFLIPRRFRLIVSSIVELLAVVPSVIYGVWGLLTMEGFLNQKGEPWLRNLTNGRWPFGGVPIGLGIMLGSIVLAVMILPTIIAVSRDVFVAVPNELIEGALSVGATRSQVLRKVVLPSCRTGILGAITLGTGRALGETIAMVFLLGGVSPLHPLCSSLFCTGGTIASEIAGNFGTRNDPVSFGILCCLAMILMVIVGGVNLGARAIVQRNLKKLVP